MSLFGKQFFHCPNCGWRQYATHLSNTHVKSMMCSDQCRDEWEQKYASMILGKDAEQ